MATEAWILEKATIGEGDEVANSLAARILDIQGAVGGDGSAGGLPLFPGSIWYVDKNGGSDANALCRGIEKAVRTAVEALEKLAKPVSVKKREDIVSVAAISANNDREIGNLLAECFEIVGKEVQNDLTISLKYGPAGENVITAIERVSKPGRRIYRGYTDLKPVLRGLGITVISTSQGIMSDREARHAKIGGEVLCMVH